MTGWVTFSPPGHTEQDRGRCWRTLLIRRSLLGHDRRCRSRCRSRGPPSSSAQALGGHDQSPAGHEGDFSFRCSSRPVKSALTANHCSATSTRPRVPGQHRPTQTRHRPGSPFPTGHPAHVAVGIVHVIMDVIHPWFFGVTMRPYKCGHLNNRPR